MYKINLLKHCIVNTVKSLGYGMKQKDRIFIRDIYGKIFEYKITVFSNLGDIENKDLQGLGEAIGVNTFDKKNGIIPKESGKDHKKIQLKSRKKRPLFLGYSRCKQALCQENEGTKSSKECNSKHILKLLKIALKVIYRKSIKLLTKGITS